MEIGIGVRLAGQATIAGFAPLTAIGLYAAGKRPGSHTGQDCWLRWSI